MNKSDISLLIFASIALMILAASPFIIYLNIPVKRASASNQISGLAKDLSEVEIYNQVSLGNIYFEPIHGLSSNIIELEWDVVYTGYYLPHQCVSLTHTIEGFKITILINTLDDINIESLDLKILINPEYLFNFISDTGPGNVYFNARNIEFNKFDFKTSSGDININLNHSTIQGDFRLSSDTGEIRTTIDHTLFSEKFTGITNSGTQLHDIWNIKFKSKANINLTSDSGYVRLRWANHFNKSHSVNINVHSNTNFKVKIWCPLEIMRSQVKIFTITGTTVFSKPSGTYEEIAENTFQTRKIDDGSLDLYNITAKSTNGEAWVYYVDCFKWSRICHHGQDFFPYNVKKSGNHSISLQKYDVSTISILNRSYLYLNESRALNVKLEALAPTSTELVFIDWHLNYIHAMGIGRAGINVGISETHSSDVLNIQVELEYGLDRILPTFNEYNITIYYHPSYGINLI